MRNYGSIGEPDDGIPEHVEQEMDAEAAAFEASQSRHPKLWGPETRLERLRGWWRQRHNQTSPAEWKAKMAARDEALTRAYKAHTAQDWDTYHGILADIRRESGRAAAEQAEKNVFRALDHEYRAREFERQSVYLLPSERAEKAREFFADYTDEP